MPLSDDVWASEEPPLVAGGQGRSGGELVPLALLAGVMLALGAVVGLVMMGVG